MAGKMPYPLPGALLPYNRIARFYEIYIPQEWNFRRFKSPRNDQKNYNEVAKWQAADSTTTAIPALHYIAVTATLEETTCTACIQTNRHSS
jgi:hypothetical protein